MIWWGFSGAAAGEYISGYLIEKSLSVDNVFVWALIFSYFKVPGKYQHRVLFWGIFGALVLRAIFIFAGVALIEQFDWILYLFGAFLLYTAFKLITGDDEEIDPGDSVGAEGDQKVVPVDRPDATARSCSPGSPASGSPRRCSPCWCWSRRPT